ncbi:MAG TPA: N-acetyltransferase [Thermofilum sp.]|nr:N-acetyltransferase [Thermofilum sp.]
MDTEYRIIHKPRIGKFLIRLEPGKYAFLGYHIEGDKLYVDSTYTPLEYRGRGIARRLMDYARENGYKIVPVCSYAVAYFRKHK